MNIAKVGNRLRSQGKLRMPILVALAVAFTALWLIFTFILNYWATNKRQEDLLALVGQIDDQVFTKTEDIRYQLLSSASLLSTRTDTIEAIKSGNALKLKQNVINFYRTYSSQSLITQVQVFDHNGNALTSVGLNGYAQSAKNNTRGLIQFSDSLTGIQMSDNGDFSLQQGSPAIDGGDGDDNNSYESSWYDDVDGTEPDIGSTGGLFIIPNLEVQTSYLNIHHDFTPGFLNPST